MEPLYFGKNKDWTLFAAPAKLGLRWKLFPLLLSRDGEEDIRLSRSANSNELQEYGMQEKLGNEIPSCG
jgi:hypothetical protein